MSVLTLRRVYVPGDGTEKDAAGYVDIEVGAHILFMESHTDGHSGVRNLVLHVAIPEVKETVPIIFHVRALNRTLQLGPTLLYMGAIEWWHSNWWHVFIEHTTDTISVASSLVINKR